MSRPFPYNCKWLCPKLVRFIGLAAVMLLLSVRSTRAAEAGITSEETDISAGGFHTCWLKADGSVLCWGFNGYGQVSPIPGNGPGVFSQVSAGDFHSCALKTDGSVACWGQNNSGQVSPVPDNGPGVFEQASAGEYHSCGLKVDGSLVCWGSNAYG
jgi:alpha-tubulin suppressor-like RCC1 family protein